MPAACARRTASSISRSGATSVNSPSINPSGVDAEQRGEALLEGRLVDLALLQRDQQLAGLGILAEAPQQQLGIDLGAQAVGVEGGEQVRGEHPAPVDQETRAGVAVPFAPSGPLSLIADSIRRVVGLCDRVVSHDLQSSPSATPSACFASSTTPSPNCFR